MDKDNSFTVIMYIFIICLINTFSEHLTVPNANRQALFNIIQNIYKIFIVDMYKFMVFFTKMYNVQFN